MNEFHEGSRIAGEGKPPAYPQTGVANTCRAFKEYEAMFRLTEADWQAGPVLDVAGGGSSFTAHLRGIGVDAYAADPFYAGLTEQVIADAEKEIEVSSAKIAANANAYDWSFYGSPEQHRKLREQSLRRFAEDFRSEGARERYVAAALPSLPFEDGFFSLAVCSHFLFLYADAFDERFHTAAIEELLRVLKPGGQLRIYPLVTLKWEPIPYLPKLIDRVAGLAEAELVPTGLPFTPTPSSLLRLVKLG
ncbi:class I SAM-dependent methyltransferase [Cohnella panacarvi]|uniref:class I SAM-dependent methyltransferase n=1 Tax=Cohnella panacarvi TaxID=400776 RepID=UPI00047C1F62|nr:class I SAM-dependent methyltransferase [Cohnella panacarvi]